MRKLSVRLTVFVMLALLLGQVGCASGPQADKSILTGAPCTPPCWQQIVPQKTTPDEAKDILSKSSYVQKNSVNEEQTDQGQILSWRSNVGDQSNFLGVHNGTVESIYITLDFSMSVKQLVDKYGPPDKVAALGVSSDGTKARVFLYYLGRGFVAVSPDLASSESISLSEGTPIHDLIYHPPVSTLDELQRDIFKNPEDAVQFFVGNSYDWAGYGPVKVVWP